LNQDCHFSNIIILNSVEEGNSSNTGVILNQAISGILNSHTGIDVGVKYQQCNSKAELFNVLEGVLGYTRNYRSFRPWLHFECHGADDGIELANGDSVKWAELKSVLTEINIASELNLMIVMGACHGAYLAKALNITDKALCWGILGPTEEAYPDDLLSSFREFYTELVKSLSLRSALEKLRECSNSRADYMLITAKGMSDQAVEAFRQSNCTEAAYRRRAKDIQHEPPLKGKKQELSIQDIVLRLKKEDPSYIKQCQYKFFMCDLFPENTTRFKID